MQALRQERPLRKGVYAATSSKGPPDREEYQGQDIHLEGSYPIDDDYDVYAYEEESEEETSDTEPITVFLGTLSSIKGQQTQEISINALDSHLDKIYAKVKINEH